MPLPYPECGALCHRESERHHQAVAAREMPGRGEEPYQSAGVPVRTEETLQGPQAATEEGLWTGPGAGCSVLTTHGIEEGTVSPPKIGLCDGVLIPEYCTEQFSVQNG